MGQEDDHARSPHQMGEGDRGAVDHGEVDRGEGDRGEEDHDEDDHEEGEEGGEENEEVGGIQIPEIEKKVLYLQDGITFYYMFLYSI